MEVASAVTTEERVVAVPAVFPGEPRAIAVEVVIAGVAFDVVLIAVSVNDIVAIATEEIALRSALPGDYAVREAQARESRTWRK